MELSTRSSAADEVGLAPSAMPLSPSTPGLPADPVDVRSALRSATAHLHAEVDTALPLARPNPTLADYQQHLAILLAWTAGLQHAHPALAARLAAQQQGLQGDLVLCNALLGRTLQLAGTAGSAEASAAAAPPGDHNATATPVTAADAADWGVAYVIEGSQLGGQMLCRRLTGALAPHPLAYLKGAGAATGRRWNAFLVELQAHVVTPAEREAACRGAVQAFESLLSCWRKLRPADHAHHVDRMQGHR